MMITPSRLSPPAPAPSPRQVWRGALLLCDWLLHAAAGEEAAAANRRRDEPHHHHASAANALADAVVLELGRVHPTIISTHSRHHVLVGSETTSPAPSLRSFLFLSPVVPVFLRSSYFLFFFGDEERNQIKAKRMNPRAQGRERG